MRAGQPSRTARQNELFRALEARRPPADRVADDPLAVKFLTPEFRALAAAGRMPPARRLIESVIDRRWPCVRGGVVARTRLIDEAVAAALPGVQQVLILGAGYDSRAYRLAQLRDTAVFEVDHPATQAAKRRILRRGSVQIPASVRFVPVDFGADDPAAKLAEGGFASGKPTLVLWEGVTNYLDPVSVDAMFSFLASAIAPGSPVLFTYVDRAMLDGSAAFEGAATTLRAVRRVGEPLTFGLNPKEVPGYLSDRGFELESDTVVRDAAERLYPAGACPSAPAYYHVVESRRV
jgi:methyltransferase (TIGR00027 family)